MYKHAIIFSLFEIVTHKELYFNLSYYYFSKHGKNPYFGAIGMYHFF